MNKKLIALAVVAAASAPLAAQADVTIYGQLHASYDNVNTGAGSKESGVTSNSSRIGFKGDEDLGNGLKGIFQVESNVALTNKTDGQKAGFGTRDSFVGVTSDSFGTVRVGRFNTPYKNALTDPFGDTIADANNIMGADPAAKYGTTFNNRLDSSVGYNGSFNGVNVAAQIGTAGQAGQTAGNSKTQAYSASVDYSGLANADFGVAYEKHNNVVSGTGESAKGTKVFGSYTFANLDNAKIGAAWETLKTDASTTANRKDWLINASVPFAGDNAVNAEYAKAKSADNNPNSGAKMEAVGVTHNFSKRTSVYADYMRLTNDSGASFGGTGDHGDSSMTYAPAAAGDTVKALSVGMITKF